MLKGSKGSQWDMLGFTWKVEIWNAFIWTSHREHATLAEISEHHTKAVKNGQAFQDTLQMPVNRV